MVEHISNNKQSIKDATVNKIYKYVDDNGLIVDTDIYHVNNAIVDSFEVFKTEILSINAIHVIRNVDGIYEECCT